MEKKHLDISPTQITFSSSYIPGLEHVMMSWEDSLMKLSADWVCYNKGDVLEFGFGMGISATYIQSHKPSSHTIIENHPQILEILYEWVKDKPKVKIIEGDWINILDKLEKYDGIFFDTYADPNYQHFGDIVKSLVKPGSHVTWWNGYPLEYNPYNIQDVKYSKINITPPPNSYFNYDVYYFPTKVFT